jgi:aryl-alcohol dehydrogenase-like predicted oxidoreductase
MADVPRISLAPGYDVSRLIKGGWQLAGGHGVVAPVSALHDMSAFVEAGITTFDCADIYTGVESLIGEFLRTRPRRDVQVHTKCVPDLGRLATLGAHDVAAIIERSRARLGVEALDLVQLHWWDLERGDFVAAARALGDLRAAGVVRNIGVTNFGVVPLEQILDAGVPVASHQVQYSLLDRRPARAMTGLCARRGIGLLCYGALAGGFMHERWLDADEPAEPLENRSLVKYKLIIDECGGWARFQSLLTLLYEIASEHGTRIGAIAIRWVLDQPGVAAVIVGARNANHLPDTLAALGVAFSDDQRQRLSAFLAGSPIPPGDVYELERDREGRHGRIMRYDLGG